MANYELVLQHHGIKGQRHGIRRAEWYPIEKYEEHLRNSGYDEKTIAKKMKKAQKGEVKYKKQVAKQRYKSLAKAQAAKKAKANELKSKSGADFDGNKAVTKKSKEEVIKTGDLKEANKNRFEYTNEEIEAIIKRNETLNKLRVSDINNEKKNKGKEAVTKFLKEVGSDALKNATKAYGLSMIYQGEKKATEKVLGKDSEFLKNIEWKKLNK